MTTLSQIAAEMNHSLGNGERAKAWNDKKIYVKWNNKKELCNYEIEGTSAVRNGSNFGNFNKNGEWDCACADENYGADVLIAAGYTIVRGA